MSKFNVGDLVRGLNDNYGMTNTKMTKGLVTGVSDDGKILGVQVLEHEDENEIGKTFYCLDAEDFEKLDKGFRIGDIVKGITDNYAFTDTRMKKAKILDIYYDEDDEEQLLTLQILKHDNPVEIGNVYDNVKAIDFALVDTENALKTNNGLKVGDFVTGTPESNTRYRVTNENFIGRVETLSNKGAIKVKTIKSDIPLAEGHTYNAEAKYFVRSTKGGFKVGDFVKGTERADVYTYSDSRTRKAEIIKILPLADIHGHDVRIKILDHEEPEEIGGTYDVDSTRFDKFNSVIKEGDLIKGTKRGNPIYSVADEDMLLAKVKSVHSEGDIKIEILRHKNSIYRGAEYNVNAKYFDKIDDVKLPTTFEVGDLVKALPGADKVYGCTNSENMILGEVLDVDTDETEDLLVKVVDSKDLDDVDEEYDVESKYFKVIGKKDTDIQGVKFSYDEDNDILYITINDKYTIAVEGAESVGVASKSEDDDFGKETGEAIAKARLKDVDEIKLEEE